LVNKDFKWKIPKFIPQLHALGFKKHVSQSITGHFTTKIRIVISLYIWFFKCARVFFSFCGTEVWIQGFVLAKQALNCLSHSSSPFCSGYFGNGVLQTICLGWLWA
jgi:hypothetical protein